jgi:hypothetical protein
MNLGQALRTRRLSVPAIVLIALISTALASQRPAPTTRTRQAFITKPTSAATIRCGRVHPDGPPGGLPRRDAKAVGGPHHLDAPSIISFAGGLLTPGHRGALLANQVDIGNAIKPFYGATAGNRLTGLLKEHILGAVALLQAAKSGDTDQVGKASAAWYANGNQIADFLHAANPRAWSRAEMRAMMKTHLDQTLKEGQDRLGGRYDADVRNYEAIHRHILAMADEFSAGIMRQFPRRFR